MCHSESVHTGVKVTHFSEVWLFQCLSLWSSSPPFFSLLNLYFHGKHETMALRMIQIAFQKKGKKLKIRYSSPPTDMHTLKHTHMCALTHTSTPETETDPQIGREHGDGPVQIELPGAPFLSGMSLQMFIKL